MNAIPPQFMSWIFPLSPYLTTSNNNLNNPSDLAIFVIRSLRINGDGTFNDVDIDNVVKRVSIEHLPGIESQYSTFFSLQFSFFPLSYMKEFHQLELDLLLFPTKPRPTTPVEHGFENLDPIHGPGLKSKSEKMVRSMKALVQQFTKDRMTQKRLKRLGKPYEDLPVRWFTHLWTLNPTTCVDWREDHRQQNATRDWLKYATYTIVEMAIAETYRQKLLDRSAAAAFLRNTFKDAMDPFCDERTFETFESPRKSIDLVGWHYPDPYHTPETTSPPEIDLKHVIATRAAQQSEAAGRKTLTAFMLQAQAMKIFMATLTTDCLDDEIRLTLNVLESVSAYI
jgi:hypothetical protein